MPTIMEGLSFEEARRFSGRVNDPKTAPMVPVYTQIDGHSGGARVKISAWSRARDRIVEFTFDVRRDDIGPMIERPVSFDDAEWLKAIGSRTTESVRG